MENGLCDVCRNTRRAKQGGSEGRINQSGCGHILARGKSENNTPPPVYCFPAIVIGQQALYNPLPMTNNTTHDDWYEHPEYYDIAFRSDTRREADFIEAACRRYCPFKAKRLLEPACGTGRLVRELAARGYDLTGFDLCRTALDYLRKKLNKRHLRAKTFVGDMTDFRLARPVDAAFCPVNTFRHLLDERDARRHLQCVADALRHGGIYILGLHLMPSDAAEEDCERWTECHRGTQVTVTLRVLKCNLRRRIEDLRVCLLARRGGRAFRLRHEFQFRTYNLAQFRRLLRSVPALELCGAYDFWYDIDEPQKLTSRSADTVFVLRKR
jgi:SAM-dependent methyltransferase